jgi:hypothetical protein
MSVCRTVCRTGCLYRASSRGQACRRGRCFPEEAVVGELHHLSSEYGDVRSGVLRVLGL